MRLIDLDKVRWKEGFYDMHTGEQYASMIFNTEEWLEWATAEAEVKAIPVEWIKHWCLKHYPTYPNIITEELLKNTETWKMLEDWEKETNE